MRYYLRLLKSFLKKLIPYFALQRVSLPDELADDELLARNIIGGSSRKNIKKKLFNPDTLEIHPSRFLDTRHPTELSVNRISTISGDEAHKLGLAHLEEINSNTEQKQTYHGYGLLSVAVCMEAGCLAVVKDDYNGKKPYHANIQYPEKDKFDDMEIANVLAFNAKLIKYQA